MKTRITLIVSLLLAVALPLTGYILSEGYWWGVAGAALAGLLWYLGLRYQRGVLVHLCFTALLALDTFIMLVQPIVFGLLGGFAALVAWDLSRFYPRLKVFSPPTTAKTTEQRHLLRLAAVIAAGLALAVLVQFLQFKLSFALAFFLSLLTLIGVRLIGRALSTRPPQPGDSPEK